MKKTLLHTLTGAIILAAIFTSCKKDNNNDDNDDNVAVTGVTLNETAIILLVDDALTLTATVLPGNATNPAVTWTNSHPAFASFADGIVTGLTTGTTRITVTTEDGSHTATSDVTVVQAAYCNRDAISFELGTQSFATAQTWIVGTGENRQEWSDAVKMSGCDKDNFSTAGSILEGDGFTTDCRNAINGFDGHYFSWCFVMRFANLLCPGDWRVPTMDDFVRLHTNLGYEMPPETGGVPIIDYTYIGTSGTGAEAENRGGTWGGSRFTGWGTSASGLTGTTLYYWSSTEGDPGSARLLGVNATTVFPRMASMISNGMPVRCVR
jgi:uncharacterized protein (TIGR02145 family)